MLVYRLKHVPSGLYYCPSLSIKVRIDPNNRTVCRYFKSNMSEKGKVYTKRPSMSYLGGQIYTHDRSIATSMWGSDQPILRINPEDWIIEEA